MSGQLLTESLRNRDDVEWGNISWAHVTSTDLLNWEPVSTERALAPDTEYDNEGVFTGCFVPTGLNGEEDQLSLVYTSVTELPIHWTLPHSRSSESILVATSLDGGRTSDKVHEANPILRGEPEDLKVTAWRDPYI